ncbi:MAG: hypothetical protein WBP61_04085 [Nocardioides sp.]
MTTTERPLRRLVAGVAVLVGTLALAGCGDDPTGATGSSPETGVSSTVQDGGEPADPTSPAARPEVDVDTALEVDQDAVRVTYRITNRSDTELLVPDRLADENGDYDGDTSRAYVTGTETGVVIAQRVFPLPDTDRKDWAQAPQVRATRIAPGETLRGEVEVPRPLERRQPYGDDLGYGTISLPDPAEEVSFCVGVIAAPYPVAIADQARARSPLVDHGNQDAAAQYLFCSETESLGG